MISCNTKQLLYKFIWAFNCTITHTHTYTGWSVYFSSQLVSQPVASAAAALLACSVRQDKINDLPNQHDCRHCICNWYLANISFVAFPHTYLLTDELPVVQKSNNTSAARTLSTLVMWAKRFAYLLEAFKGTKMLCIDQRAACRQPQPYDIFLYTCIWMCRNRLANVWQLWRSKWSFVAAK